MNELISPKYQMKLVESVGNALWEEFKTSKYYNIEKYNREVARMGGQI